MRQHRRCCGMITTTNCPEVRVRLSAELAARHLQPDRRGRVALEHRRRGSKCGCAPDPRTSKATSTSRPCVISRTAATRSTDLELTVCVAPSPLAAASISSEMSMAVTSPAPSATEVAEMLEALQGLVAVL